LTVAIGFTHRFCRLCLPRENDAIIALAWRRRVFEQSVKSSLLLVLLMGGVDN
jgi:hypothetical protein